MKAISKRQIQNLFLFTAMLIAFTSCKVEDPEFKRIEDLVINKMESEELNISLNTVIYNPNSFSVTLKECDIQVTMNNNVLTNFHQEYSTKMEGQKEAKIPVNISVPMEEIFSGGMMGLLSTAISGVAEVGYEGHAKVKAMGVTVKVPIKEKVKIKL